MYFYIKIVFSIYGRKNDMSPRIAMRIKYFKIFTIPHVVTGSESCSPKFSSFLLPNHYDIKPNVQF